MVPSVGNSKSRFFFFWGFILKIIVLVALIAAAAVFVPIIASYIRTIGVVHGSF